MKPNTVTCLLFLFCVINLFFGCSRRKAAPLPELEQAEAVMFDRPDSALHILQRMPKPTDKEQHALWCLLMTQAECKQLLPVSSDSLIRIAYDYYKPTGDARRKAMSALYMGIVNYKLRKAEEAQIFYLEASAEVEQTSDYKLGYLIMYRLGELYLFRDLSEEAWKACQKAYDYAEKSSCEHYVMTSLRLFARYYTSIKDFDKAVLSYKRAIKLADSLDLKRSCYSTKSELAGLYYIVAQYEKALVLGKEVLNDQNPLLSQICYTMGLSYKELHQYDSAYYFLTKALHTTNIYTRGAVYENLYELSNYPPFQKYMKNYGDSMLFYRDSIYAIDKSKEIIAYKKRYENEKLITENQRLELDKAYMLRLLLLAIIVVLVVVYLYQRKKMVVTEKQRELNEIAFKLHENEDVIAKNNSNIANLKDLLAQKDMTIKQQKNRKFY